MKISVKADNLILFFLLQKWILILLNSLSCIDFLLEAYMFKTQRTSKGQKDHLNNAFCDSYSVFGGLLCYGLYVNLGDPEIFGVDKPALWRFIFHDLSSSILCKPSLQHWYVEALGHLLMCNIHLPSLAFLMAAWLHKAHLQTAPSL